MSGQRYSEDNFLSRDHDFLWEQTRCVKERIAGNMGIFFPKHAPLPHNETPMNSYCFSQSTHRPTRILSLMLPLAIWAPHSWQSEQLGTISKHAEAGMLLLLSLLAAAAAAAGIVSSN